MKRLNEIDNGFYSFGVICVYVLGVLGSLGWCLYEKAYPIAVANALVAAMAFPYFRKHWKNIAE
jgi:hypothetical protein